MACEVKEKLSQLRHLSDSILRAGEIYDRSPSYETALAIQRLRQRRADLQATLPPLRAVAN